jgi:hypothetical protein
VRGEGARGGKAGRISNMSFIITLTVDESPGGACPVLFALLFALALGGLGADLLVVLLDVGQVFGCQISVALFY